MNRSSEQAACFSNTVVVMEWNLKTMLGKAFSDSLSDSVAAYATWSKQIPSFYTMYLKVEMDFAGRL